MTEKESMAGWVFFAAIMLMIIGVLDVIQGLVALLDDNYYAGSSGTIVNSLTAAGWILLIWGCVVAFAGYALLSGASWGRWVAILFASLNLLAQLGFDGRGDGLLWGLVAMTLDIMVLYALIARWEESKADMASMS